MTHPEITGGDRGAVADSIPGLGTAGQSSSGRLDEAVPGEERGEDVRSSDADCTQPRGLRMSSFFRRFSRHSPAYGIVGRRIRYRYRRAPSPAAMKLDDAGLRCRVDRPSQGW
jgi:hypothetical protein